MTGYGTGFFGVPNSSLRCRHVDQSGQQTGDPFDVYVASSPPVDGVLGKHDLTEFRALLDVGHPILYGRASLVGAEIVAWC